MPAFFSSLKLKEVCSFQPRHESRISREFMKAVYTKTLTETKEDVFRLALSRRIFRDFFFLIYSIVRDTKNRLISSRGLKVNLVISLYTRASSTRVYPCEMPADHACKSATEKRAKD